MFYRIQITAPPCISCLVCNTGSCAREMSVYRTGGGRKEINDLYIKVVYITTLYNHLITKEDYDIREDKSRANQKGARHKRFYKVPAFRLKDIKKKYISF